MEIRQVRRELGLHAFGWQRRGDSDGRSSQPRLDGSAGEAFRGRVAHFAEERGNHVLKKLKEPTKYCFVIALCGMASVVGATLSAPSSSFVLVVIAVSLYMKRRQAVFAIVLCAIIFAYQFLFLRGNALPPEKALLRLGVFVGTMIVVTVMIESRRRADELRVRIGQEFRSLAETSPDCILFLNSDRKITFANFVTEKMFGFALQDLLGKPATLLLPELETRPALSGEFLAMRRDGRSFYVESACGSFGEKTTIFLRDITERKQALQKLEATERSLRLTLETIPGLVFTRSAEGRLEYTNGSLRSYIGAAPEGVGADVWAEALHPEDRTAVLERTSQHILLGEPFVMEYRLRRHDGVYQHFQTRVQPLRDDQGQIIRWYGLATDIEERLQAEEALRQTQLTLAGAMQVATAAELSASIVHEISQPLSAMVTNGQACLRWLSATPPNYVDGRTAVERIVRDGKDASAIIKGLRSLFGRAPLIKLPVDLCEVLAEVVALLKRKAEEQNIVLEMNVVAKHRTVLGDKLQLQQVVMNLINNGIESMQSTRGARRKLMIRVAEEDANLLTSIEDEGAGAENYESIFEAFVTTKEHGMGMGLAICRSIIQLHEGRLWGRSSSSGGSIFAFTVPYLGTVQQ